MSVMAIRGGTSEEALWAAPLRVAKPSALSSLSSSRTILEDPSAVTSDKDHQVAASDTFLGLHMVLAFMGKMDFIVFSLFANHFDGWNEETKSFTPPSWSPVLWDSTHLLVGGSMGLVSCFNHKLTFSARSALRALTDQSACFMETSHMWWTTCLRNSGENLFEPLFGDFLMMAIFFSSIGSDCAQWANDFSSGPVPSAESSAGAEPLPDGTSEAEPQGEPSAASAVEATSTGGEAVPFDINTIVGGNVTFTSELILHLNILAWTSGELPGTSSFWLPFIFGNVAQVSSNYLQYLGHVLPEDSCPGEDLPAELQHLRLASKLREAALKVKPLVFNQEKKPLPTFDGTKDFNKLLHDRSPLSLALRMLFLAMQKLGLELQEIFKAFYAEDWQSWAASNTASRVTWQGPSSTSSDGTVFGQTFEETTTLLPIFHLPSPAMGDTVFKIPDWLLQAAEWKDLLADCQDLLDVLRSAGLLSEPWVLRLRHGHSCLRDGRLDFSKVAYKVTPSWRLHPDMTASTFFKSSLYFVDTTSLQETAKKLRRITFGDTSFEPAPDTTHLRTVPVPIESWASANLVTNWTSKNFYQLNYQAPAVAFQEMD